MYMVNKMEYKNHKIEVEKIKDNVYYVKIDDFYLASPQTRNDVIDFPTKEMAIKGAKLMIDEFNKKEFKFETSTYIQRITKRGYIIGEDTTKGDGIFFQKQKNSSTWYWKPMGVNTIAYPKN